ncbi:efflux RND transporter periplasmic adaptor subunit [Dyella caseinilytica]|uniref:Efflux RND transporter periplasmic adaptor subunit n=1 Tax=Dyella caseinilytica TaxID=1849581 RepID=A0ABX7GTN1_9GAMM|nr:efflux RND transporter periplasmic adaptor subunit [Dyella caseinilytica]QRN52625.1 efflux RND transporter periplasmic adaptor subunit [Dyella caseinilytica]GGA07466.1 secretion protein HlyD [Dyella caseinilytica]
MSSANVSHRPGQPSHGARLVLIGLGVVLIGLAAFGIVRRLHARHDLTEETDRNAVATVATMMPKPAPKDQALTLPGTVASWQDAQIYARTTGYVAKWYVDIGARVKKSQKLADLDTPDVDNQLLQGKAQMRTDIANMNFAKITADRYDKLVKQGLVAAQTGDQYDAQYKADVATVEADEANVAHLQNLEDFKYIVAPFDGVITQRNLDIGALVDAGSTGANMFVIADTSKLRVYVDVPETYAASIKVGMPAEVGLNTYGAKPITGTVARTADALDPNTRTLRTEIDVDNSAQEMVPGVYANVKLAVSTTTKNYIVPANTLLFRSEGLRVALVDDTQHIHLQPVTLGRDFGNTVEVIEGLADQDRIVINPPDSLSEGQQVSIAELTQAQKQRLQ